MAIREEKNRDGIKTYTVAYTGRDERGQRTQCKRRGIKTIREAKAIEFELKRQFANQRDEKPNYKWEEWFQICMDRMKLEFKPSTIIEYTGKNTHWMAPVLKGKLLKDISPQDMHDVVYKEGSDVTWYTRRGTLRRVHRIMQMAVEEGLISVNPAGRIRVKVPDARQAILNKTEIDKFLLEAKKVGHRFYDVWVLALMTGMRSGELFALKWDDICFEQNVVVVQRSWTSKNGFGTTKSARYRVVPVSDELGCFLKELKLRSLDKDGFVLPRIGEWSRGNQAQVTKDFCIGIGITPIRFHDLRATFITQMLANGVSLALVMAIVGHSEIKTTQGYLRLAGLELKGTTDLLGITLPTLEKAKVLKFRS